MFDKLMTQQLTLRKKNGKVFKNIPASVQDIIFISEIELPIEEEIDLNRFYPLVLSRGYS